MRVAISQRFLPHYRVGFFDQLDRRLQQIGGALRVFFSYEMGRVERIPSWAFRIRAVRKDVQLGELEDSAVVAPSLLWHLVGYSPDVVVVEDLGGLPNSLIGATYCRLWRKPYLVWGLGHVPQKRRSKLRIALAPAIWSLYGGASGFVCYSRYAADVYSRYGKPPYVAPNAYLPRPAPERLASIEQAIQRRYSQPGYRVISIGTLRRQKRYDVLLSAIARMPDVTLDLIGDGPEASALKQLATDLRVANRVMFHGAVYSEQAKAGLLASAHVGVVPGRGGLAIQEMMAHGVPVVSGVADGTEQDLIRHGESGYLLDGFPTADQLVEALIAFAGLTPVQKMELARAALTTVVNQSNISVMADAFLAALRNAASA